MGDVQGRLLAEERHPGKAAREEALLIAHAESLGIPVERTTWKPFLRKKVQPRPGDVVAGSVSFVRAALQSLGKQLPPQNPYPAELAPWLYRKVWQVPRLGDVLTGGLGTVFVRPAKRWKLFTGFVVDQPNPAHLYGVSRHEPVWCSEVVTFVSEWRVYVVEGCARFIGLSDHGGNRDAKLDLDQVTAALGAFTSAPAAYAIDFGVLDSGETALIEVNDGFSVGAYDGIPAKDYWDMTATRWHQLAKEALRERSV